jgi:hypothetical protein
VSDPTAERIARNDHRFRQANEQIREAADEHRFADPIPFLCECADERCTEIVQLTREEYASIRSNDRRFVSAPGHTLEQTEHEEVVERTGGYDVMEKTGEAAEIAEELAE